MNDVTMPAARAEMMSRMFVRGGAVRPPERRDQAELRELVLLDVANGATVDQAAARRRVAGVVAHQWARGAEGRQRIAELRRKVAEGRPVFATFAEAVAWFEGVGGTVRPHPKIGIGQVRLYGGGLRVTEWLPQEIAVRAVNKIRARHGERPFVLKA